MKIAGHTLKKLRKARIAQLPLPRGAMRPSVSQRFNRLNPQERAQVKQLLQSLSLRQAVRRTLYIHYHQLHEKPESTSLQQLRVTAAGHASNTKLPNESNKSLTPFELHVTTSEDKTHERLIVPPSAAEISQA